MQKKHTAPTWKDFPWGQRIALKREIIRRLWEEDYSSHAAAEMANVSVQAIADKYRIFDLEAKVDRNGKRRTRQADAVGYAIVADVLGTATMPSTLDAQKEATAIPEEDTTEIVTSEAFFAELLKTMADLTKDIQQAAEYVKTLEERLDTIYIHAQRTA